MRMLGLVALLVVAGCGDNVEWKCSCEVTCEDTTESVEFKACATEDEATRAQEDAIDECGTELAECSSSSCECTCRTDGDPC